MGNSTAAGWQDREAGAAALENTTDNFSTHDLSTPVSDSRWWKLEHLRTHSVLKRQRLCMTRAHAASVSVRRGASSMNYGGVMACGSRTCPVCAPTLYAQNRDAIKQAVHAWREGEGGTVLFGTFTIRHHLGQRFDALRVGVAEAWHAVTGGRGWLSDRRSFGVEHWVRVFEEKWSAESGWHLHIHYLMFVSPGFTIESVGPLLQSMFRRWNRGAQASGFDASMLGQDLHVVDSDEAAASVLADYFTKQAGDTASLSAAAVALELTMRDGKFSKHSLTPGEILTLSIAGLGGYPGLWAEYERGMHGRRVIAWSRGLRDRVGIGDELTDTDAAQLEAEELMRTVMQLRGQGFRKVTLTGRRRELLTRAWVDPAGAVAWLASLGIDSVEGTFDRAGDSGIGGNYDGDTPF